MAQLYPFLRWLWLALGGVLIIGPLGNFFYDLYTDPKHAQASVILDFLVTHWQAELAALCFTLLLTRWSRRAYQGQKAAAEQQRQEQADQERRTREVPQQPTVHAHHISSGRDTIITTGQVQTGGQQTGLVSGDAVAGDKYEFHLVAPSASLFPLHQLRAPVQDFVGRTPEQARLIEALRTSGQVSISGIQGMGGIGKTELALVVANAVQADYPDAQLVVDLRGTEQPPREPADALRACIRAFLGPEVQLPETVDELTPAYTHVLSGKRALLLLDNAADSAQVWPLLPPAGCALLVTSRNRLILPNMTSIVLEQLAPAEAHALLVNIDDRIRPQDAEQISELCGHLPLALRAAGSLLAVTPDLAPAEYIEQLREERTRLTRIGQEGVERDVEASFTLSYDRLSLEAAHVFRSLAVFPASFDAAAAAAVCEDAAHTALSELVRRSLVLYAAAAERYRLHDLVRVFASHRLSEGERAASEERHAMYYCDVAAKANQLYLQGGDGVGHGLALFDREWGNIQAGQGWAVTQAEHSNSAAQLCLAYPGVGAHCFALRLHPCQRILWLEQALAAARYVKNRAVEGAALVNLGNAHRNLGEVQKATNCYHQALAIMRELGDRRTAGIVLGSLGNASRNLGEVQKAVAYLHQALTIAQEFGDRHTAGITLGNLGLAYADLGDVRQAIAYQGQALTIARELGDRHSECLALSNLGSTSRDLGEVQKAVAYLHQAFTIARELGDRRSEGIVLVNLGNAHRDLGEVQKAVAYQGQALTIARELGDRRSEGAALSNLGLAYADLGKIHQAIDYYTQALTIMRELGDRRNEGAALGNLGLAYAKLADVRQAIDYYAQALTIACEVGNRHGEGSVLFNMSMALDRLGNRPEAIPKAKAALAIFEQIEDPGAEQVRELLAQWRAPEPEE